MNLYTKNKISAKYMADKIIEKHSLEIKTEDIRPYLQQTFFNGKTDFDAELPKNLFTEKKLIEVSGREIPAITTGGYRNETRKEIRGSC